jgi:mersacidin/lichenicidin family type 2 lantibiotic
MSRIDIIRAWKDEAFRNSLSQAQRDQLPANPAGTTELTAEEAAALEGGLAVACCTKTHHCVVGRNFNIYINPVQLYRM